jgi:hypothetical protein
MKFLIFLLAYNLSIEVARFGHPDIYTIKEVKIDKT